MTQRLVLLAVFLLSGCVIDIVDKGGQGGGTTADATGGTTGDGGSDDEAGAQPDVQGSKCPAIAPCKTEGVCASITPVCRDDGTWDCQTEGILVPETCDGLDNDCDGTVDEDIVDDAYPGCGTQGVCAVGVRARCIESEMVCEYLTLAGWEVEETLCDGEDNDCDGETDEGLKGSPSLCHEGLGVCAASSVTCNAGEWECTYPPTYEEGLETRCDGLDNNCDGTTDSDDPTFAASAGSAGCPTVGACSAGSSEDPHCKVGVWDCSEYLAGIPGYSATESCNAVDDDCDGKTDEDLTGLDTTQCDPVSQAKAGKGVCAGKASPVCQGGTVVCVVENVSGYEASEVSCDGQDNDCDGLTDEDLTTTTPPAGACSGVGECKLGVTATCTDGIWNCAYSSDSYESGLETACDGKDNDCNGVIDEDTVVVSAATCPGADKGVCAGGGIAASCFNGKVICDYSLVSGYEPVERSCDGKDNDCDGLTDEGITDLAASTCLKQGQCAIPSMVVATCQGGAWTCDYGAVPDYQAGSETLCDGKDNDCDGFIDEGIIDPAGLGCPSTGVCAGTVRAVCNFGGEAICDFSKVVGFQTPETECDGVDNNCDGETDEGVCDVLQPCQTNVQCTSGACKDAPNLEDRYCVSDFAHCPTPGGAAQITNGDKSCLEVQGPGGQTQVSVAECTVAGWSAGVTCEFNACVDGVCSQCNPGRSQCSASQDTIIPCSDDGVTLTPVPCPAGTQCEPGGQGLCLCADEQVLTVTGVGGDHRPTVLSTVSQQAITILEANVGAAGTAPVLIKYDTLGCPTGQPIVPLTQGKPSLGIRPDGTVLDASAVVLVWQVPSAGDDGDIMLSIENYLGSGQAFTGPTLVNTTTAMEQGWPRVVKTSNNQLLVAWQSQSSQGGNGRDIHVRGFQVTPVGFTKKLTGLSTTHKTVNTFVQGDQERPSLALLEPNRVLVAWQDATLDVNTSYGVYARVVDATGTGVGNAFSLNNPEGNTGTVVGDQTDVEVAPILTGDGGFVAVWTSTEKGNEDIVIRTFGKTGLPVSAQLLLTDITTVAVPSANQRNADVAVMSDGQIIVVFEDTPSPEFGSDIYVVQLTPTLQPKGPALAQKVNILNNFGHQTNPAVAPIVGGSGRWMVVAFEDEKAVAGQSGVVSVALEAR